MLVTSSDTLPLWPAPTETDADAPVVVTDGCVSYVVLSLHEDVIRTALA